MPEIIRNTEGFHTKFYGYWETENRDTPCLITRLITSQHFHDNVQVQSTESQQEGHYATVEKTEETPV